VRSRHPISISALEVAVVALVAISGIVGFFLVLQQPLYFMFVYTCNLPECCGDGLNCDIPERYQIFRAFSIPLAFFLAIGGLSIVRAVRNDVRGFSPLGHAAMAWPAVASVLFIIGGPMVFTFVPCIWPIPFVGLVPAVIATRRSIRTRSNRADLIAIVANMAAIVFHTVYFSAWSDAAYIQ